MRFDFLKNEFLNTSELSSKPFIVGSDRVLSEIDVFELYLELREKLLELKIPEGHPVCIYGEKEAVFPVAMITLISLNIPYVPIDAIMPVGRIEKIKEQTNSLVLINCSTKECEINFDITFNKDFEIKQTLSNSTFSLLKNGEDPIRYILFTSGSTGVPKGVQITKTALNSFVEWYTTWPLMDESAVFMNQAPFSFDVSLCDFIGAFANGSKIILNNYQVLKNGSAFLERLRNEGANTLVCTPSFLQMYLSVPDFNKANYPALRQVVFMGEELLAVNVKKLMRAFPEVKIVNAYGPTEATVVTTYIELTNEILSKYPKSLPIGYCRPNSEIIVLDKDSDTGVGELGICGPNLSLGYLNDLEKTHKAFVFYENKLVYKTGDIGFIDQDLVFYMGRNDSQVKLNGYRIELDEINNVLLKHQEIKNAAVIPLKAQNVTKKLICFVILSHGNKMKNVSEELKNYLLVHLPSYMIPSEFVVVESFPLNSNYKTDKNALLETYLNG